MREPVSAEQLRHDLEHIAEALSHVHDPLKRYLITLLVDVIADHCVKHDPAAQPATRSQTDDRPRGKPH